MISSLATFDRSEPRDGLAAAGVVVICGSMSALGTMHRIAQALRHEGVPALVPDTDDAAHWDLASPQDLLTLKRVASITHLKRVKAQRTAAVLAVNLDRHGVHDYIGPNTFAELALGFAHGKRLYVWQDIPEQYNEELEAWGAVSLDGRLEHLLRRELLPADHARQLSLFDGLRAVELEPRGRRAA